MSDVGPLKRVTIVMPCWNEEASIAPMVAAIEEAFSNEVAYEVRCLFVDDGSTDATWKEIQRVASFCSSLRVGGVRLRTHQGKEYAQAVGVRALEDEGGLVVLMDSDGQHSPAALVAVLPTCEETGNVSHIAQRVSYTRKRQSNVGVTALGQLARVLGVSFDAGLGEFMVLSPQTVSRLRAHPQFGVTPVVPLVEALSDEIVTFPVEIAGRFDGSQSTRWTHGDLWQKAAMHLLADPRRLLPRLTMLATVLLGILALYGLTIGVISVAQGTFLGVGSILVTVVLGMALLVLLQIVTLGLLVVALRFISVSPDIGEVDVVWLSETDHDG